MAALILIPTAAVALTQRGETPTPAASSTRCTVSPVLVNSCRAWLGAATAGNPGAAHDAVSQFTYLEKLVGHPLDVYRDYDKCGPTGCTTGTLPLAPGSPEQHFALRPDTYVDVNWKPAPTWLQADGGDPLVDKEITQVADNVKAVAPHQVFLTVWHEPQNDVTPGTSSCGHLVGTAGSPAQYIAMWRNVENIFHREGVTNVVWDMNYMGSAGKYDQWHCLVPQLWPGNDMVDWVTWDTYSRGMTWDQTSGTFYQLLESDNSPTMNVESKPWGIGEFGTCKQPTTGITAEQYFDSIRSAVTAGTYPRLKMYLVFADTGNNSGPGCLTDYDTNGQPDPAKQVAFNQLADTVLQGG